jgi:hypothetical protein
MEIIVLPFMSISLVIAWAVFAPFASIPEMDDWTFAKVQLCDLLAIFVPFGILLMCIMRMGLGQRGDLVSGFVFAASFGFTLFSFFSGLFVIAKMASPATLDRVLIIGFIIPVGSFLSLAWVVVPALVFSSYAMYSMPVAIAIVPVVFLLRQLSNWVCRQEQLRR